MDQQELNRRAQEVFYLRPSDFIYDVYVEDGQTIISMRELGEDGDYVDFKYTPDMSNRPEALDYLLGKRNDFNDQKGEKT